MTPMLSAAQRVVLVALCETHQTHGSATVASVRRSCGLARSTTHAHLRRLQRAGFVEGLGTGGALRPAAGVVLTESMGLVKVTHLETNR